MLLQSKKTRTESGSILGLGLALLVLLIPIGAVVYDVTLIRMQYNQLKAATDTAALTAASWARQANNTKDVANLNSNAQTIALPYFRSNFLSSGPKYDGSLAAAVGSANDIMAETLTTLGESKLHVTVDPNTNRATAQGAFCLQPSLLSFFGLYTLHAKSVAGPGVGGTAGDVCFVIDLSASMTNSTPASRNVVKIRVAKDNAIPQVTASGKILCYAVPQRVRFIGDAAADAAPNTIVTGKGGAVHPFCSRGFVGNYSKTKVNPQIPNPNYIDFKPTNTSINYVPSGSPLPQSAIPSSGAPRMQIDAVHTPLLFALLDDFASRDPNVEVADTDVYPNWPKWPPINPSREFKYGALPAGSPEFIAGQTYDAATPDLYDATTPVKIKTHTNYTIPEMMTLILYAAKAGVLEDKDVFTAAAATRPELFFALQNYFPNLGVTIPFKKGYQREYNALAMTTIHAVETQVAIIHDVIEKTDRNVPDAHWSLIGFGRYAPGTGAKPAKRPPSNEQTFTPNSDGRSYDWKATEPDGDPQLADQYQFPQIPLSASNRNSAQLLKILDETTVSYGTATPQGLEAGIDELTGSGHRNDQTKTLVLMTDGLPTQGGSYKVVKQTSKNLGITGNDIHMVIVGLFEGGYACPGGPNFLRKLRNTVGPTADFYPVNKLTRNCGKIAGDPTIDLSKDASDISNFIIQSIGGGGGIGLIE